MAVEARSTRRFSARNDLRLVVLGAPGSGKGTQAEALSARLEVPAISTGEMLRQAVASGSSLGRRVERIMAEGSLVDDETIADLVRKRLAEEDARRGFILDGFPRTMAQAESLQQILEQFGTRLDTVVRIEVPEEELVRRALARRRSDDREEVIRRRLEVYREQTEPLIGYYREQGLLHEVAGDRTIEAVTEGILSTLAQEV